MTREAQNKIKIDKLEKELARTFDQVERARILAKIEAIKKEEKDAKVKKMKENTKINSVSEAPVVMDRGTKNRGFNGHIYKKNNNKAVNGVYQKSNNVLITF